MTPTLYIVVPCYNEEKVLPITSTIFADKIGDLISRGKISERSKVLFVNDGSKDGTWDIICGLIEKDTHFAGIALSRNRGHQNALWAGLMEAEKYADITISIDCDGQDDVNAMDDMIEAYYDGCQIVYGVRKERKTDTPFKRFTAEGFYRFLRLLGAEVVFNHADYRLLSQKVLEELAGFKEVNLYLRGMIPLVGFKSTCVYYERKERAAGKSHYPLGKMIGLALDGITSLSIRPLRMIIGFGMLASVLSFIGIIWAVVRNITGHTIVGWASMVCVICFVSGIQLLCLGVIGEYIGKIYLETKQRPKYIIEQKEGLGGGKAETADKQTAEKQTAEKQTAEE
ncbi:MAG: glycosyltransferase family 2 protein [Ruminococcus sp.]|nr:glycosyltransferase family 2 protein [Ruminococcus sp.]